MLTERFRVRVAGMTSPYAVQAVFTSLTAVEGIISADVGLGVVEIEHDGRVTSEQLRAAITVSGFDVLEVGAVRRSLPVV